MAAPVGPKKVNRYSLEFKIQAVRLANHPDIQTQDVAHALDIPVATGENLYTPADFARFLQRDAVDIIQPDLRRGGGPTLGAQQAPPPEVCFS